MTNNPQFQRPPFQFNARKSPLAITAGILVITALLFTALSGFYADWLWFKSVDFTETWSTILTTKAALFVVAGLLTSFIVMFNVLLAYKRRPLYVPVTVEADNLERYRSQVEPIRRPLVIGLSIALFYFAGTAGSQMWSTWLQFRNSTPFGVKDPQFNMDISFFAFRLPFWQTLISWGISTLVLAILGSVAVHYLYGGIRLQVREDRTTVAARVQLSVCLLYTSPSPRD